MGPHFIVLPDLNIQKISSPRKGWGVNAGSREGAYQFRRGSPASQQKKHIRRALKRTKGESGVDVSRWVLMKQSAKTLKRVLEPWGKQKKTWNIKEGGVNQGKPKTSTGKLGSKSDGKKKKERKRNQTGT